MFFQQLTDLSVKFSIQVRCMRLAVCSVQFVHEMVHKAEIMQIVDLFFLNGRVKDFGPDLFIVPADKVKLLGKIKQHSLVEADFFVPEGQDDMLFEVGVEQLFHVVSVELSVVAEGLEQARDFHHTNVVNVVLNFGCPEVNSVEAALVTLVVAPQGAKSNSTTHMFRAAGAVMLFKHLEHGWVVDLVHCHVVQDKGHLFEWQVVPRLVMAMVDVLKPTGVIDCAK